VKTLHYKQVVREQEVQALPPVLIVEGKVILLATALSVLGGIIVLRKLRNRETLNLTQKEEKKSERGNEMFVAKVGLKANTPSREWIIVSGASRHMTFEKSIPQQYKEFKAPEPVGLGDGRSVEALGVGSVKVTTQLHNGENVG